MNLTHNDGLKKKRKLSYGESFYEEKNSKRRPRLVKKCGELNIQTKNVDNHKMRLFKDFFNTIIGNHDKTAFLFQKK